jgi:hypothetical protein
MLRYSSVRKYIAEEKLTTLFHDPPYLSEHLFLGP